MKTKRVRRFLRKTKIAVTQFFPILWDEFRKEYFPRKKGADVVVLHYLNSFK